MQESPSDILQRWIVHAPMGRVLDVGAGNGEVTCWLAKRGYSVDAVEKDEQAFKRLCKVVMGLEVNPFHADVVDLDFSHQTYALIFAPAVIHFLKPTDLWPLVDKFVSSLASDGLLIAQVLTTDDPGYEALVEAGAEEIEPNTFVLPPSDHILHYFSPGELKRIFSMLTILEYEEARLIDDEDPIGYRSGASIVARKEA
jgi:tellurite methyltransferase